ncbi:MAG: POTRA domain-containing protein, partial [Cyanobacteriota bacterium]
MRFSPVVLAAIAISSVSGLAAPAARAQTAPLSEQLSQRQIQRSPDESEDAAALPGLAKPDLLPGAIARAEVDAALGTPEGAIAAAPVPANSANSANPATVSATVLAGQLSHKPAEPQRAAAATPSANLGTADPTGISTLSELAAPQTGPSRLGDPIELAQFVPQPQPAPGEATPPQEEPRVLVSELVVSGAPSPELEDAVFNAISTRAGATTTRTQLQQDINAVFATGFFSDVRAVPEDTPLGVRVTFVVQPNPVLTAVQIQGNEVLPQQVDG